jgi:hypothetical protein
LKENTLVDVEYSADPLVAIFHTNRPLSEAIERYDSPEAAALGNPLPALLATIDGVAALELNDRDLKITRAADAAWEDIALQVIEALKDFYLL